MLPDARLSPSTVRLGFPLLDPMTGCDDGRTLRSGDQFSLSDSFPGMYMDAPDSEYLSFNADFGTVSTPCCSLPADVFDRCSDGLGWSSFVRFADDCLITEALRFEGREPRTRLPEFARMSPMASAADPLASFSACSSWSFLASLSHQNSQARESCDRPLADRRSGFPRSRDTRARSREETPGPWLLLKDCLKSCDGRGGEGEGLSLVMIFAAPSEVIERRTNEDDFFNGRSGSAPATCSPAGKYSDGSRSSLKDDARRLFARYP